MPDFSTQIDTARNAGYSDEDIVGFLSKDKSVGPQIQEALSSGYRHQDILSHLSTPKIPGMEKLGALPGVPAPPGIDQVKSPEDIAAAQAFQARNGTPLPNETMPTPYAGFKQIERGVDQLSGPDKVQGGLNILGGGMTATLPFAAGSAIAQPVTTAIRAGVGAAAGYGVKKGAQKLGADEITSDALGAVAGIVGAGIGGPKADLLKRAWTLRSRPTVQEALTKLVPGVGDKLNNLRKVVEAEEGLVPQAPEPFRPNPNIAKKIRYGGPTESDYSNPNPMPRSGRTATPNSPLPTKPKGVKELIEEAVGNKKTSKVGRSVAPTYVNYADVAKHAANLGIPFEDAKQQLINEGAQFVSNYRLMP